MELEAGGCPVATDRPHVGGARRGCLVRALNLQGDTAIMLDGLC